MTENHGYNTPAEGSTNWDVPLNENFATLDADVEVRDAEANRGNYAPRSEAKFLATDTGAVYIGDGDAWNHLGDVKHLDAGVYVQSGAPSSPATDDLWIDTDDAALAFYDGSSWVTVGGSTDTSGSSSPIVEDGEGDLSAYTGDASYYGITSEAISGSGSVVAVDAEKGGYRTIVSTSGLANYPQAGDTFQFQVAVDTKNTYGGVLWGVQSAESPWPCYRLRLDTGASPGIDFEKITTAIESSNNPEENKLAPWLHDNEDVRPEPGTAYTVTVEWGTDGLMPFTIEETETGDLLVEEPSPNSDTEYTGGGVGFMSSRSWDGQDQAEARFDGYELI